ncbi:MAG: hypothetical protein IAG13_26385 [Deltaproteobacteria bacterium]|nr:hypothetical protein [Nannocystaceae bacterium]
MTSTDPLCPPYPRPSAQTDLGLRERVVAANASLGTTGIGIGGKYEERAVGQVTDSTYQLALRLESVRKDYNDCVVSADTSSTQAQVLREQLTHHVAMVDGLSKGVTAQLGDEIWSNAVPTIGATVASSVRRSRGSTRAGRCARARSSTCTSHVSSAEGPTLAGVRVLRERAA